ncbi:MAG: hypothetical protein DRJ38_01175 [Thermoprotei archaeon]|nr:MAG: hypothetical protein DRJ38_01175 [Thermoprotei archaeon]
MQEIIDKIIEYLKEKDGVREELIKASREIIRKCRDIVNKIHRRKLKNLDDDFSELRLLVEELRVKCKSFPDMYHSGIVQEALMEYYEAWLLYEYVKTGTLETVTDLPREDYVAFLLGLADVAGEFRRELVQFLLEDDIEKAEKFYTCIEEIYSELSRFSFPDALTPGLRRKVDRIRYILESSQNDILYAKKTRELLKVLDK